MFLKLRQALPLLAALGMIPPASAADHVKVGSQKTPSPIYIAIDRGYFAAEGIEVEQVFFEAGQPVAVATASGSVDFGIAGLTGGLYALCEQGALKIIGGQNREVPGFRSNVAAASNKAWDAGLRSFKDLPGHSVAITQIGSSFHYDLALLAAKYGFDLASIKLMPLQSNPNAVSAVVGGSADAAITVVSYALPSLEKGDAKLLGYIGDETPWQLVAIFAATATANERPDTVRRFLAAFRRGARDFHDAFTGPDGKRADQATAPAVLDLLAKDLGMPARQVSAGIGYIDPELRIDVADIDRQVAWYKGQNLVKGALSGAELIDLRYALPLERKAGS